MRRCALLVLALLYARAFAIQCASTSAAGGWYALTGETGGGAFAAALQLGGDTSFDLTIQYNGLTSDSSCCTQHWHGVWQVEPDHTGVTLSPLSCVSSPGCDDCYPSDVVGAYWEDECNEIALQTDYNLFDLQRDPGARATCPRPASWIERHMWIVYAVCSVIGVALVWIFIALGVFTWRQHRQRQQQQYQTLNDG